MTTTSDETTERPLGRDVMEAARYYVAGRRGLVVVAGAAVVAAGLALNWSWPVAAGFAPLLLSVLPCVAMCALGLCMSRMTPALCAKEAAPQEAVMSQALKQPQIPLDNKRSDTHA